MEQWQFHNSWFHELPKTYSQVTPDPIHNPYLVAYSDDVGQLLDLREQPAPECLCRYFSGQSLLQGSQPIAQIYAGHQFGQFVPKLGDGRAMLLGQITNSKEALTICT